jgi:NAD(P)H-dependent FMN reductase
MRPVVETAQVCEYADLWHQTAPVPQKDNPMANGPILLISGTNRPNSNAIKITRVLEREYRAQDVAVDLYNLTDLPREIFDPSSYAKKPESFIRIQQQVQASRGLHIVVPEYNGSFPGALKYFIDMLKFPESFDRKPVAFVGESAGMWGGLRPVEHLQMVFAYRNAHIYPDRVFISGVTPKLDADGNMIDASIADRLKQQVTGFTKFADHFAG